MIERAALVTGAARRVGRALALDLAAQGFAVAVHCNSGRAEAEAVAAEAVRLGAPAAAAVQADLLDHAAVDGLIAAARAALGGRTLGLLVNNASIFERDSLHDLTRAGWDRHIDSNLWAAVRLTQGFAAQVAAPASDHRGLPVARACVVNMIDQRVWKPTPEFMTYTIAKMGLWAFTRTAAQALAPRVRVMGIGPGPTLQGVRQDAGHFAAQMAATPLERGAEPAEIAAALRFILASPSLTGQMLALDGGQHLAWRTPDVLGQE